MTHAYLRVEVKDADFSGFDCRSDRVEFRPVIIPVVLAVLQKPVNFYTVFKL